MSRTFTVPSTRSSNAVPVKPDERARRVNRPGWAIILVAFSPVSLLAADPSPNAINADRARAVEAVDMFRAIEDGKIDVRLIPKNSRKSNVLIGNKTDTPLRIQLPDAFAGVPVLAQIGGVGNAGGNNSLSGANQGIGGGFGGGLGGGGFGGGGGGFFNIAPEKTGTLEVTTVCLEHGKREPRPAMTYQIEPISQFTDKAEVHELCRMLGDGIIDQRSAQAAAWHLSNNMTWQQLAAKQLEFANGTARPYFHPAEIRRAMQAVSLAKQRVEQREHLGPQDSPQDGRSTNEYGN